MNRENNEEESEKSLPSIRRKYQGGRHGRSNINYGVVLKTSKREIHTKTEENPIFGEERIIIGNESKHNRGIAAEPVETETKITTTSKKYVKEGYSGKTKKLVTTTKTETTESQKEQNNSRNSRQKEDKGASVSKISEINTITNKISSNNIKDNRNGSQGRKIREEVTTTKTITSTTTNQVIRGESGGKKEIIKTVTNETSQNNNNQQPLRGKKEEIITTKTTTTVNQNQRSGSQNKDTNNQKGQITSIKTITTNTTTNERQIRGKSEGQNQKIQTNKEITINQRNSSSSRGKNQDKGGIKESTHGRSQGQKVEVSKEVTTNERTSSRGRNQGQSQNKEITTNQKQNSRRESQNKQPQVVKEVTSITSVNKRNEGNKNTVTTTKTITTANQANKGKKVQSIEERAKSLSISSNNQFGVHEFNTNKRNKGKAEVPPTSTPKKIEKVEKKDPIPNKTIQVQVQKVTVTDTATNLIKKPMVIDTAMNQKNFRVQQPPQALKTESNNYNINTNKVTSKLAIKEKEQKPYSTNTEIIKSRHNLSRITINESGKTPKKKYALHVRKLDRIQSNSKMRILYTNNMEETTPVKTNFNHNITIIRNVTSQNLFKNSGVSNIARKEINESGKEVKQPIKINQRLNEIIRTEKKPYKLNYKDFNEKNAYKKLEVKSNLQNKMNNTVEQKNGRNSSSKKDNAIKTTTTETKLNSVKGGQNANKISTTTTTIKTEINTGNKGGRFNQLQMSRSNKSINENSGANENKSRGKEGASSTNSRGSKTETVTVKTTQVIKNGSGSTNNSRSNSVSRGQKESSITMTKTITKTVSKNESNQNGNQGEVAKRIRAVRMIRTEKK